MKKMHILVVLLLFALMLCMGIGATFAENIDPNNDDSQYAYGENIGWFNLEPSSGPGVTVTDTEVSGFVWQENIGWINLDPSLGGVVNDGTGNLSGFAWGENVGWINFGPLGGGVSINACGEFNGMAWGENVGWLSFRSDGGNPFRVITSWVSPVDWVLPDSHDFGNVNVGSASPLHTFTVTNMCDKELIIGTLGITGADTTEFIIQSDNCSGQTIAASGTCTVDIVFSPSFGGIKSANLTIPFNDPVTPTQDVLLSGTGKSGPIGPTSCPESISPVSKTFGSDGGTDSVTVAASGSCDWTATSSDPSWLEITPVGSGTGGGIVNYSVSANTGSSRTGTITITGDTSKVLMVAQMGVGASPAPDIKASSSDGPVTSGTSDILSVTVSLAAGGSLGMDCDWWVAAATPFGWYYFDASTMSWAYAGDSYTDLSPTYQGSLFDLDLFEVLNMSDLPVGTYTFYFAVDTNMNGVLDFGELFFDSVVVNITP